MQVAGYGVQKLLMQQFFTPEANTLYTPLGRLDKDILFWTTMGLSRGYNIFLGVVERLLLESIAGKSESMTTLRNRFLF